MKFKKLLAGVLSAAMVATMIPSSLAGMFVSAADTDLSSHLLFQYTDTLEDQSGKDNDGVAKGNGVQTGVEKDGRSSVYLSSTSHGGGSIQLPDDLTADLSSKTGFTFTTWINAQTDADWARLLDIGEAGSGQEATDSNYRNYFFVAQNGRIVSGQGNTEFYLTDTGVEPTLGEWHHIAIAFMPEVNAAEEDGQNVGVILYVDGEVAYDASVNQTNSGTRNALIAWCNDVLPGFTDNYIGYSRFDGDAELNAYLSDMRFYDMGLTADQVVQVMADGMTTEQVLNMAKESLTLAQTATSTNITLPATALAGLVNVTWASSKPNIMGNDGTVGDVSENTNVTMTATLTYGDQSVTKEFNITVYSPDTVPYVLNIDGDDVVMDVSDTLFGLFYEDINNAADGGIYAELVQNRSFEFFTFSGYDSNYTTGASSRTHNPLQYWTGDTSKMTAKNSGGLDETNPALALTAQEDEKFADINTTVNSYYVTVAGGATIKNQGYTSNNRSAMNMEPGAQYNFSIYARGTGTITVYVEDDAYKRLTAAQTISLDSADWKQYSTVLTSDTKEDTLGTLVLEFSDNTDIDMVSLMPVDTWGYTAQDGSETANANYTYNSNYRLREDLMQALLNTNPSFLRFPGGCISEGSYTWDNVYDWKKSIGTAEQREENYNVWGYSMTMGLGYLEYFQMAEDLGAEPLPVMACGVLCQARSDGANAAGGALMDYYIQNFKDLIEFANGDESTEYGALRAALGHPEPFNLKYLGVGNENWGNEFFANFEVFYAEIMAFCKEKGYDITIISTTGAQANDSAYQSGWEFLAGEKAGDTYNDKVTTGMDTVVGESGSTADRTHTWYTSDSETDLPLKDNYMDTIADEHYYRSNEYLLNNTDRYDYYERAYNEDGTINDELSSKVFVGEYASTDKNTLMGALSEAAIMTSYEQNSDVVRLAATAPLFNKERDDSLYRWTPDVIWFDNDSVWFTPTYYVQSLFPSNLGDELLRTDFEYLDESGEMKTLQPEGGVMLASGNAPVTISKVTIYNADGGVYQTYDFTQMSESDLTLAGWSELPSSTAGYTLTGEGLTLAAQTAGYNGIYLNTDDMPSNYKVVVDATRTGDGPDGFYVGVGVTDVTVGSEDMVVYSINYGGNATGFKVYKDGVEGYTLGDYSVGTAAGNTYLTNYEPITTGTPYEITVDYGTTTSAGVGEDAVAVASGRQQLNAYYTDGTTISKVLNANLTAVNDMIYNSVTKDDEYVYIKLVNVDGYSKTTGINIDNLAMSGKGTMTVLSGTADNVNTANVNTDGNEVIAPKYDEVTLQNGSTTITLPAYSLTVLKLEISDGNVDVTMGDSLAGSYTFDNENLANGAVEGAAGTVVTNKTLQENDNTMTYVEGRNGGKAVSFDGTADGNVVKLDATLTGNQQTISFWMNTTAYNNFSSAMFALDTDTTNYVNVIPHGWDDDSLSPQYAEGVSGTINNTAGAEGSVNVGEWHMVTFVVDGTSLTIYKDGQAVRAFQNSEFVDTASVTDGFWNTFDSIYLGGNLWDNTYNGAIDDVYLYNKALTAEEVAALYGYIPSTGVSIDGEENIEITRGDSVTLNATVYPVGEGEPDPNTGKLPGAATNSVTWSSSHPEIATVSKTGTVRGVAAGQATITATTTEGFTDTVTVKVNPVLVNNVTINTAAQTIDLGASLRISATASPSNADNKTLKYESSKPDVATINEEGILTTKGEGTTTITVTSTDGSNVSDTVDITVKDYELESVVITNAPDFELVVGSSLRLRTEVTPGEAAVAMSYETSNPEVATVEGGMLSIVGVGEATITVKATKLADANESVSTTLKVTAVEQGDLVADYQFNGNLINDANKLQEGSYQTTTQGDLAVDPETGTITFNYSSGTGSANRVQMENPLKGKDLSETGFTVAVKLDPTAGTINQYEGIWGFDDGAGFFGLGGNGQLWFNDYNGNYYDFIETAGNISANDGMELITVTVDPVQDQIYFYKDSTLIETVKSTWVDAICTHVSNMNYFNLGCAATVYWGTAGFTCDYLQVYQRQLTDAEVGYLATTGSIEEPETVNKSALDTMVTKAAMIDGSIYTQSSWTPFVEALNAATAVIKNEQATNQDVLTAQNNLNAAMEGLDVYAPISTPEVDVEYTFDGTLDATTGDAAAAELTGNKVYVGTDTTPAAPVTAEKATFAAGPEEGTQAVQLSPSLGYGLKLDLPITDSTFTVSFDVSYAALSTSSATMLIANDTLDQYWSSIGQGWKTTIEDTPMIWSRDQASDQWMDLVSSNAGMALGEFATITAVFDNGTGYLYVNGTLVGTGSVPNAYGEGTEVYLGVNAWDAIPSASVANVQFYDEALVAQQVAYVVNGTEIVYDETPAEITPITGEELTATQAVVQQAITIAQKWTGDQQDARYTLLTALNELVAAGDVTKITSEQATALQAALNNVMDSMKVLGDKNGDGVLNVLDVMCMAQYVVGSASNIDDPDVNNDGQVNLLDVMYLAQVVNGTLDYPEESVSE